MIFREGEPGDGLFMVIDGSVRISKHTATGEEALAILEPNAFFGEMALIDFLPRAADAIANAATEIFFIPLRNCGPARSRPPARHEGPVRALRGAHPEASGNE